MKHTLKLSELELAACVVCCGGEGTLPTDCPGIGMSSEFQDKVYSGQLDFRQGRGWVRPNGSGDSMGDQTVRIEALRSMAYLRHLASPSHPITELSSYVLDYKGFSSAPGGKTRHHDFYGGLATHTKEVVDNVLKMAQGYDDKELTIVAVTAAVWHDLGKVHEYEFEEDGSISGTDFRDRIGHLAWSWAEFDRFARSIFMDEIRRQRIGHAMLAHHGRLEWRSPVEPKTIEAHILHAADMMSMQAAGREHLK